MNDSAVKVEETVDNAETNGTERELNGHESNGHALYNADEMCEALKGIAPETLDMLTEHNEVIRLTFLDGTKAYPAFQVSEGRLNSRLSEFFQVVSQSGTDSWTVMSWLNTPWDGDGDTEGTWAKYYGVAPLNILTAQRDAFDYMMFDFLITTVQKRPLMPARTTTTTAAIAAS